MTADKILLLRDELADLEKAAEHLRYSLELTPTNTLLDRIHRAEKRGWIDEAERHLQIRELRNLIAHEYATDKMAEIYFAVASLSPILLTVVPKAMAYAQELEKKYSAL